MDLSDRILYKCGLHPNSVSPLCPQARRVLVKHSITAPYESDQLAYAPSRPRVCVPVSRVQVVWSSLRDLEELWLSHVAAEPCLGAWYERYQCFEM